MEKTLEDYKPLIEKLESDKEGYYEFTVIPGKGLCAIRGFIYTVGLVIGLDETGYKERYCYPNEYVMDAVIALKNWNGEGYPPGNWIKRKGIVEETNPNYNE